jgi:hypothetical protein
MSDAAEVVETQELDLTANTQLDAASDNTEKSGEYIDETEFVITETQDVVENLESIALSLESILASGQSLDANGFRMYQCAMNSNLRRLGIDHTDRLPSMETFNDPVTSRGATYIAMEGVMSAIGDAIAAIWKWIMDLIKGILSWLGFGKSKNEAVTKKVEVIEKKLENIETGKIASYKEFKLLPEQTQAMLKAAKEADKGVRRAEYNAKQAEKSPPAVVEAAREERKFKIDRSYKATVILDDDQIQKLWIEGWNGADLEKMFSGKAEGFVELIEGFRGDFTKNVDNAFKAIDSAFSRGMVDGLESGFKQAKQGSNAVVEKFTNQHGTTSFGGFKITKDKDKDGNLDFTVVGKEPSKVKDMTVSINFNDLKKLMTYVGKVDDYDATLAKHLEAYQGVLEDHEKKAQEASKKLRGDEKGEMKGAKTAMIKTREVLQVLSKFIMLVRSYRSSLDGAISQLPVIAEEVARQTTQKSLEAAFK